MKGEALKLLQAKCGVTADGAFGPNTARAIAKHYGLNPNRGAHLLGQIAHESGGFMLTCENLNYRAETMCKVWPKRFPTIEDAMPFARNPEALAEKVYSGRMGNDNPGDGAKFIGRGFIQLTGRDNYTAFSKAVDRPDVLDNPGIVETELAMESAIWFFDKNGLFDVADGGVDDATITKITKRVNGGTHGLDDRIQWTKKIHGWLSA